MNLSQTHMSFEHSGGEGEIERSERDLEVIIILSILTVFVAVINIYCIIVILYSKRLHKGSHLAICSLLLAHALQGVLVIPLYAIRRAKITNDPSLCTMFRFTYLFTNYASCISLLIISLDRCFGVTYPLKYKIFITPQRMLSWLAGAWLYVLALCCIPFFKSNYKCGYIPQNEWTIGMLLANTMVPFIVIFVCYFIIFGKVKQVLHNRRVELKRKLTVNTRALRKQWKKSKITVVIVFFYVVCWGPGFVYYTLEKLCKVCFQEGWDKTKAEQYVTFVIKLLTFVDGIIAPLLYCLSNKSFIMARNNLVGAIKSKCGGDSRNGLQGGYTPTMSNRHLHATEGGGGRIGQLKKHWSCSTLSDLSVSYQEGVNSAKASPTFELKAPKGNHLRTPTHNHHLTTPTNSHLRTIHNKNMNITSNPRIEC